MVDFSEKKKVQLIVNGKAQNMSEGLTVAELIDQLRLDARRVACEVNETIVRRAGWGQCVLRDGDVVEIVQMMGGG